MTAAAPRPRRRLATVAGDVLLTLASLGGVVCIALVALAAFFDITLIMFSTGSMSPTIPAGSLAVVREVPASEVGVGDVVTVDRPEQLPVTHRIVAYEAGAGDSATFVMRGDANDFDDAAPYTVDRVREVLFSVPQLAHVVSAASHPLALGGITVAAALLVTWAFWPRDPRPGPAARPLARHAHSAGRHAALLGVVLCAGVTAMPAGTAHAASAPSPGAAADVTDEPHVQVTRGRILTLTSIGDRDAMMSLDEVDSASWQVGVRADPPEPGGVEISIAADGDLVSDALWLSIDVCDQQWWDDVCASGGTRVADPMPASELLDGPLLASTMHSSEERWIRVEATLRDRAEVGVADLRVIAYGGDELLSTGPGGGPGGGTNGAPGSGDGGPDDAGAAPGPGGIAVTGADPQMPLRLALGAVSAGLALALVARHRRGRGALS